MRLAIITPWGRRLGGAEAMLLAALRHIDRRRFSPTVIFLEPGPFEREVAALDLPTEVVEAGRIRQLHRTVGSVGTLARLLRTLRQDLILNWSPKTQLYGATAACLAGRRDRVVWWQHGVPDGHWMDRAATRLPARAVGCSSRDSERAQRHLSPQRRTFVVHPGVEVPAEANGGGGARIRLRLAIPDDALVVGIAGRLQPWKGQHIFLRALARLRERCPQVHGLVVGGEAYGFSAGYARELRKLADELGLNGAVTFTGQVPDATAYMRSMDVFVNASDREPFGIVLLEAMALEIPVVAIARGGPNEIVEHGRTGMLVEPREPTPLAGALEQLVTDPNRRRRMASAGHERYRSHFTAEAMTRSLEEHLLRVG